MNTEEGLEEEVLEIENTGSQDLFDSDNEDERQKEWEKNETIQRKLQRTDKDLVESEAELPECVKRCHRYKERKEQYIQDIINSKFELSSSQDILQQMSQLPSYVQDHKLLQEKLKHLTKQEKSDRRCMKSLRETLAKLREDSSQASWGARVLLIAGVYDHRYGCPDLGETRNAIAAAKKLKNGFLQGDNMTMKLSKKEKPQFPKEVFDVAHNSWLLRSTKPDPGKHARPKTTLKDGSESVPSIWQVVSDDEAYAQFKENDKEIVTEIMKKHCDKIRAKYQGKRDSTEKKKILESLDRKEKKFPGRTWFLQRKPPQTKQLDDFATALCKECNEAQLNYETIIKYCKKFCQCKTAICPNYICGNCDEEENEDCECQGPCQCDDCQSCQVNKILHMQFIHVTSKSMSTFLEKQKKELLGG